MQYYSQPFGRRAVVAALFVVLGACALPRSGPSEAEIRRSSVDAGGDVNIVDVDDTIARLTRRELALGFDSKFLKAKSSNVDVINPGDVLSVTIWENVDNGLFATLGQKVTQLPEIQVDQSGTIFIPFAGRMQAGGKTSEQVRSMITASLEAQTPDPQVEVRRVPGDGASVTLVGSVAAQGVYPITAGTRKLSGMLASAGGVTIPPEIAQISVQRRGRTGRIWLQDLYSDTSRDIALRPRDRIVVEADRRVYTALGATGQTAVPFSKKDLNLAQALAEVGGLNSSIADPTGIFVFRIEPEDIARKVLGKPGLVGQQKMAYVLNLTQPGGMFAAREFLVRDGDTIYVTEAPFVAFSKVLGAALQSVNYALAFDAASRQF
ncbi:MAG: polysaccharide biosynthesis/export family protein [Paracoccaceae bacterium]